MSTERQMTRTEREELKRLARERARVAKADAARRTADLKAMFEQQMVTHYDYDRDEVWSAAYEAAKEAVAEANEQIAARCVELGIPRHFAPQLGFTWEHRNPQFQVKGEQQNLRRAAYKRLEAMERTAKHEIDRAALDVQTQLVRAGLTSEAAVGFLEGMPAVEALMPALDLRELTSGAPPLGDDLF